MPTEVSQAAIDLDVPVLESASDYKLIDTGHKATRTFPTIVLEHELLRVQVVPDLGGRIISVVDKRSGQERILLPNVLAMASDGAQGLHLPYGIQLYLEGEAGWGSMDPIALQVDESRGSILMATHGSGPLCSHVRVSLVEGAAALRIEARISNRGFEAVTYHPILRIPEKFLVDVSVSRDERLDQKGHRLSQPGLLGGRQVDEFTCDLIPTSGSLAANGLVMEVDANKISLQSTAPREVTVLLMQEGETFDATTRVEPLSVAELPFGSAVPDHVAIFEGDLELLRWPFIDSALTTPNYEPFEAKPSNLLDPSVRHLELARQAIEAFRTDRWEVADAKLEKALLFNAEDPLLWWAKAVAQRHLGQLDGPELENAHYLAPLDPVLRAEAWLRQPTGDGAEANPMLAALADHPDEMVEIAAIYVDHGLYRDASRLIGELLRLSDLRMLRLLLAFAIAEGTKMEAEAAVQVSLAAKAKDQTRVWRPIEQVALARFGQ